MQYIFSKPMASLKPSAIREILKSSSAPDIIPFSAGNPAEEAFPAKEIATISNRLLCEQPNAVLQYSVTEGYEPLRQIIRLDMKERKHIVRTEDEILITAGAQQVMHLAAKILADAGDTVLCEDPSFIGSLNAFRAQGLRLVGVPMASDGIDLNALESALKREKKVRFLYVIPNFQNPSGITMSLEKRQAVYALAKQYDILIVEDNPYGELRFAGEDIPTIKSMDIDGRVIYAGSFSKVLAPALRLGYAIADSALIAKMTVAKQTDDVHTTMWSQLVAESFLREYDFNSHLERIRAIYRRKANLCMDLANRHLAEKIEYHPVEGGLFLWCKLPNDIDMMDFCRRALEKKVAVVPGTAFAVDPNAPSHNIRINYSTPSDRQLEQGMERLGTL